jgi:hypothetical protein
VLNITEYGGFSLVGCSVVQFGEIEPRFQRDTGWCREKGTFEIIRKKTKETYKTLFDHENVFYKSGISLGITF